MKFSSLVRNFNDLNKERCVVITNKRGNEISVGKQDIGFEL